MRKRSVDLGLGDRTVAAENNPLINRSDIARTELTNPMNEEEEEEENEVSINRSARGRHLYVVQTSN